MKVYLASSFELIKYVQDINHALETHGHKVTVQWWHKDFKKAVQKPENEWYEDREVQEISRRNFSGIEEADCLILVAHPTEPRKFNGANIELGYALALKKPCLALGKLERSAMYVPVKRITWSEFAFTFFGKRKKLAEVFFAT